MERKTLWTRNYSILTAASVLGAAGGIAGGYAMSFLVFDETGSTLAAGFVMMLRIFPQFFLPMLVAPWMDRLKRKPFLVYGDLTGGILYFLAGMYLINCDFSYMGYLFFSLLISAIGAVDSLAYYSIYPKVIPEGFEQKGYSVSGMLYPVMTVLIMPVSAVLLDEIGVARILILQGCCSIAAAILENRIEIEETIAAHSEESGLLQWWEDFKAGFAYLKGEKGLLGMFGYMAVTNGAANGIGPIILAFFRTAPGFTAMMYSFFSVAEFAGRTIGGMFQYKTEIPKKKRFMATFYIYQFYEIMDMILLWIPYPLMLLNRGICGFLGMNSATLRQAAVQRYLPDKYRARVNAFENGLISAAGSIFALIIGSVGEILDYKLTVSLAAGLCIIACWLTIWKNRSAVRAVYESPVEK